ncbi:hypothetical protein SAMN05445850_7602 [Paraburkholderia tuberum]|uniref:Uncharacterized protein n=1 Tax=Paraburkholderia tuberum TaxID=157910 RepID=A0A1H1KFW5_9BURK|nr:hypothetical protein SAMN05445850_7602 [Paraburkholderia tuberum]
MVGSRKSSPWRRYAANNVGQRNRRRPLPAGGPPPNRVKKGAEPASGTETTQHGDAPVCGSMVEKLPQLVGAARVHEFSHRLAFDLPDPFARQIELFAELLERMVGRGIDPETHP